MALSPQQKEFADILKQLNIPDNATTIPDPANPPNGVIHVPAHSKRDFLVANFKTKAGLLRSFPHLTDRTFINWPRWDFRDGECLDLVHWCGEELEREEDQKRKREAQLCVVL